MLLTHDPSLVRLAAIATARHEGHSWGDMARADARALIGGVVRMLGEGLDEGPLVQVRK